MYGFKIIHSANLVSVTVECCSIFCPHQHVFFHLLPPPVCWTKPLHSLPRNWSKGFVVGADVGADVGASVGTGDGAEGVSRTFKIDSIVMLIVLQYERPSPSSVIIFLAISGFDFSNCIPSDAV